MQSPIPAVAVDVVHKGRIAALDVLRGIAILGVLLTNIWIFSTPNPLGKVLIGNAGIADEYGQFFAVIYILFSLVTDGKFISLLTIMFGIGLEIQRQAAIRQGSSWPGSYPWRAAVLVLYGFLNYIFIFEHDVLMGYGLTALAVSVIMMTDPRVQKFWMILGLSLHIIIIILLDVIYFLANISDGLDPSSGIETKGDFFAPVTYMSTASYGSMVYERIAQFVGGRMEIPIMFFMGMGIFLVGAHLYRAGIFKAEGKKLRMQTMAFAFGVGLPLDWCCRLFLTEYTGSIARYITSSMVACGVLAVVAAWYANRNRVGVIGTALSAVGKMALTCYIVQNILASIIFYDWGFGVAGRIEGAQAVWWTLAIYCGLALFLVAFSLVWLHFFTRGPLEWLWHKSYEGISHALSK